MGYLTTRLYVICLKSEELIRRVRRALIARFRVQVFKSALDDLNWLDLIPDVTATGATAGFADPIGVGERFYRVLVLDQ